MDLSILIPTFARPDAINRCLRELASQSVILDDSAQVEIIVALDGPADRTPDPQIPSAVRSCTRVTRHEHSGLIKLRRIMQQQADGDIILWLNDDAYPQPGLLRAHLDVHTQHAPCVVAGGCDWQPIADADHPDLFDLIVQQSDLVFFQEPTQQRGVHATDYRNCFGLNMSFPRSLADQAGGVPDMPPIYGYEDIELAYRIQNAGAQLLRAPHARVTHDHRYRPLDVHRREYLLGQAAWHFARVSPGFAMGLFGRDLTHADTLDYFEQALEQERRDAIRIERSFLANAGIPLDALVDDPAHRDRILSMLAEHWLPLKRYLWRWGLVDASRGRDGGWSTLSGDVG